MMGKPQLSKCANEVEKREKTMNDQTPTRFEVLPGMQIARPKTLKGRLLAEVDAAKYKEMLDAPGMTDAQKDEALKMIWEIVTQLVDLGFQVDPVSQACGQKSKENGTLDSDVLSLDQPETHTPTNNSASDPGSAAEGKEES